MNFFFHRATSAAAYQTGQAGYAVTPAATAATYTQRPAAAAATGYETYQAAAAAAATGTTYAGKFFSPLFHPFSFSSSHPVFIILQKYFFYIFFNASLFLLSFIRMLSSLIS